jgi:molybdate transport system permease protein
MGTDLLSITAISMKIACTAVAAIFPIAVTLSYLSSKFKPLQLLEPLWLIPLVLPPSASGLLLLLLFSTRNPLGKWLQDTFAFSFLLSWQGAAVAAAFVSFPLLYRCCGQAFLNLPSNFAAAAYSVGANAWNLFWHIELPLAAPQILYGSLLAFARSLGEFGATMLVAGLIPGETETFSLAIYARIIAGQEHEACQLALLTLLWALLFLLLSKMLSKRLFHWQATL